MATDDALNIPTATDGEGFRMRGNCYLLTYTGHVGKQTLLDFLLDKEPHMQYVAICHETSEENNYEHTHAYCYRKKARDIRNCVLFDYEGIHPNIRPCKDETHKEHACNYVHKQDEDVLTWGTKPDFGDIMVKTIAAIQRKRKWGQVVADVEIAKIVSTRMSWAKDVFMHRPRPDMRTNLDWYPGPLQPEQQQWLDALEACNRRQFVYVCDPVGALGKSDFGIWLSGEKPGDVFMMDGGSKADIAYAYNEEPYVIIDIPRDTPEDKFPTTLIENFKRGWLSSSKYQSCTKQFTPAKLILFANKMIDQPFERLTHDRWVIFDYSLTQPGPYYGRDYDLA